MTAKGPSVNDVGAPRSGSCLAFPLPLPSPSPSSPPALAHRHGRIASTVMSVVDRRQVWLAILSRDFYFAKNSILVQSSHMVA